MMLLHPANRILAETVAQKLQDPAAAAEGGEEQEVPVKRELLDVRLCDFDDVSYHVQIESKEAKNIKVSMYMPFYKEIREFGAEAALKEIYGPLVVDAEQGQSVTLSVPMEAGAAGPREELVDKVALLRANVIGGVFRRFLQATQSATAPPEPFRFKMRSDVTVYLCGGADSRTTVVYEFNFANRVDQVVAGVFVKEFVETRRRLNAAPTCNFYLQPPLELQQNFGIKEAPATAGHVGYISFAVLKSHVETPEKLVNAARALQMFRNFLQYHLKCSKSFFHARMRARVKILLKVLNRAKAEPDENAEKKLASGKTFKRL